MRTRTEDRIAVVDPVHKKNMKERQSAKGRCCHADREHDRSDDRRDGTPVWAKRLSKPGISTETKGDSE
jgi:hypothetical protein